MPAARTPLGPPVLRGLFHAWAFWLAIPGGVVLFVLAEGSKARVAAAIFGAAVAVMFGASGLYHRFSRTEAARRAFRRLDQIGIFGLIAGSYTAVGLLVLGGTSRIVVLAIVWTGAAIGIATKLYRVDLHVLSGFLYLGLGWVAVIVFPALVRDLTTAELTLMVAGGLLYSGGALVLALHRPNPWPRTFGYHEIWHAATIGAAACLYAAILSIFLSS